MWTLMGTCHCGAIRATLHSTKAPAALHVRACQCSFCMRHGAMTVSDPAGRATFQLQRAALTRYQFGTRTGTSLICARCGVYAGVILEDGGETWSVLNVRGLAVAELQGRLAEPVVYDGETPKARIARRKAKWTPTEILWLGPAPSVCEAPF
ncbi:MAG: hypothetical protein J2P51_13910 [Hyphomicrobiaceae bacterium]|nr:hypothetical protein [Hyphomicrobiaceae bacterium]